MGVLGERDEEQDVESDTEISRSLKTGVSTGHVAVARDPGFLAAKVFSPLECRQILTDNG